MGFLSRFFKPKAEQRQVHEQKAAIRQIALEDVDRVILENSEKNVVDFKGQLADYKSRFTHRFSNLIQLFEKLEEAPVERIILENNRDVTDIVRTSRAHYCQSSKKLINDTIIRLKMQEDPEKLNEMVLNTFQKLNSLSKQAHVILATFREDMKEIAEELKRTYAEIESLDEVLKSDYERLKSGDEMRLIAKQLMSARNTQAKCSERLEDIEKDLKEAQKNLKTCMSERDELLKSKEYMHHERVKDELEDLILKKRQVLREIEVQAGAAEKILQSYLHSSKDPDKGRAEIALGIIKEPEQLIAKFSVFESALKNAGKIYSKAEKGKKKKSKAQKPHITILKILKEQIYDYEKLMAREQKIEKEKEKEDISKSKRQLDEIIEELEEKIRRLEKEKEECSQIISKKYLTEQMNLENFLSSLLEEKVRVA